MIRTHHRLSLSSLVESRRDSIVCVYEVSERSCPMFWPSAIRTVARSVTYCRVALLGIFVLLSCVVEAAGPPTTEFTVPTADSQPWNIATGPDGNLWFTEFKGNNLGRITPDGVFGEAPIPTANSGPVGITAGADGNLWFT